MPIILSWETKSPCHYICKIWVIITVRINENTANLLASYINAIRADVSVKREYVRRLVEELFPAYNVIAQAQLQQLTMIQINTAKNVEFVEEIRNILHRNINGVNKFNV